MSSNFRDRLKRETLRDHSEVDALFSTLDLSSYEGFTHFVHAHALCFRALSTQAHEAASHGMIVDLAARLAQDLAALDPQRTIVSVKITSLPHPLAVDYMVLGSRFGTNVLRKRWLRGTDHRVRQARAYFSAENDTAAWPAHCDHLAQIPAHCGEADRIIEDVRQVFSMFSEAFEMTRSQEKGLYHVA